MKTYAVFLRDEGKTYGEIAERIFEKFGWRTSKQTIAAWFKVTPEAALTPTFVESEPANTGDREDWAKGIHVRTLDVDTADWPREFKGILAGHISLAKYCIDMASAAPDAANVAFWGAAAKPHSDSVARLMTAANIDLTGGKVKEDDPMREYKDGYKDTTGFGELEPERTN